MTSSTPPKKTFRVGQQQVRVRPQPNRAAPESRWLQPDEQVQCDPNSRTESEGFIWWKHTEGWTAERSLDGKYIYLTEVISAAPVTSVAPAPVTPALVIAPVGTVAPVGVPAPIPVTPTKTFIVGSILVRIRSIPSASGALIRELLPGTQINVEVSSRTEAEGFVWWKHSAGWSVERTTNNSATYLYEPGKAPQATTPAAVPVPSGGSPLDINTLPLRENLFKRFPVDLALTRWWQYFGNNVFAQQIWSQGKRWYEYAQGLHGGFDFGNSSTSGVIIYAGVEGGTYDRREAQFTPPYGLWVKKGDYTIIYGHVTNPRPFNPGDPIGVDTILGELEFNGQNHLHLEIRYKGTWIVNPIYFFPKAMQDQLIQKFPPGPTYFYSDPTWNKWQSPYDQPVLRMGGPLIGPQGPR